MCINAHHIQWSPVEKRMLAWTKPFVVVLLNLPSLLHESSDITMFLYVQITATCQLLAEVQRLAKQQLQLVNLHTIEQYKLQATQLRSKLKQYVKHLEASDPLYQQIPYLAAGMHQEDCTVPARSWQRAAAPSCAGAQQEQVATLPADIGSHASWLDADKLEQLQAAFAHLDGMVADTGLIDSHNKAISKAEELLQSNLEVSSWLRAIAVCQQLEDTSTEHSDETGGTPGLLAELAALCAVVSPDKLAPSLQQYTVSQTTSGQQQIIPPGFLRHIVTDFASFRLQQLHSSGNDSYRAVCRVSRDLQQVCEADSSIVNMGSKLIGQYELLQLLYRQRDMLATTIASGTKSSSAMLKPVGLSLLDAAVLISPEASHVLMQLAGCQQKQQVSQQSFAECEVSSAAGAAAHVYQGVGLHNNGTPSTEVFMTSAWLPQWQQGILNISSSCSIMAAAMGNDDDGDTLQQQLATALTVLAACAAAAGCSSCTSMELTECAKVRSSSALVQQQERELADLQLKLTSAQKRVQELRQSR